MISHGDHIVEFVDDYLHELLTDEDARYVQSHVERCPICRVAMEEAIRRLDLLRGMPSVEPSAELIQRTVGRVMEASGRTPLRTIAWRSFAGAMAAAILIVGAINLHYLFLSPSPYDLKVLAEPTMMPGTDASIRAVVMRHDTGAAVADAPVRIELLNSTDDTPVKLASFTTDSSGTGEPRFRLPEWNDGQYALRITASPGGEDESITVPVTLHRSWKLMLSSDKPVYQPGQVMHFRALTLREPDLHPVAGKPAVFSVADPKGDVIFKSTSVTSRFGITSANCPLATEILEGDYAVSCQVGDTESRQTLEVKKYVLPKFKIDLTPDKPYYQPGEEVNAAIHAAYFFGKPVAHGVVDVTAHGGLVDQHQTLITDSEGNAELHLPLADAFFTSPLDRRDAQLTLDVVVHDSAGQEQEKTVERVVSASPLHVEIIPDSGGLMRGVASTLYVLTTYPDGSPAPARVAIAGIDRELQTGPLGVASFPLTPTADDVTVTATARDDHGLSTTRDVTLHCGPAAGAGDFAVRTDKAVYRGGESMTVTALGAGKEPVFIDLVKDGQTLLTQAVPMAGGRGQATIDFPADVFGTLTLDAYRMGGDALAVRERRIIYVEPAEQLKISIGQDAREYRPGGEAKLRFALTDAAGKPAAGALSLAAVDESVFSVLEQRPGMEKTFFTLEQNLLKPIAAIYQWSPDQPVSAADGGERSELEQALFAHATEEARENPLGFSPLPPGEYPGSIQVQSAYADQAAQVTMRRESALNALKTFWGILAAVLVLAGIGWVIEGGNKLAIAAVFLALLLCGAEALYVRQATNLERESMPAGMNRDDRAIPETLTDALAAPMAQTMKTPWFADSADQAFNPHRNDGQNVLFSNLSTDAPVPRVRQWFPETLLWRPELITDDAGHANLDLNLADSITDWRLSASAVDGMGRLGSAKSDIRVFQPFFVDMNLPVALTRGDEISLPVVVYSYSDRPQSVEVSLDTAGNWFTLLDTPSKHLQLAAGQVASVWFRLRVTGVGFHALQVVARGGGVADAEKRTIEVVASGPLVEKTINGTLHDPANISLDLPPDAIPGSGSLVVKIYPSTFSQVVEGLDGIFQRPYGCFEQTSSTTYPNVLALQYLRQTHKSVPSVEAKAREYINLGYQRLVSFEVPGGGFDWFGHPAANPVLTAYGLMEFQDMSKVSEVDPKLIERTRSWLLSQRNGDGSWNVPGMIQDGLAGSVLRGGDPNVAATAYIAWAVFGDGQHAEDAGPTLDYLRRQPINRIDDPYVLAVLANALEAMDPTGPATAAALDRLSQLAQSSADGKEAWWSQSAGAQTAFYGSGEAGSVETTAMSAIALIDGHRDGQLTRQALTWLVAHKDSAGAWPSTQATDLALKALIIGSGKPLGPPAARTIRLTMRGGFAMEIPIAPDQAEVMKQVDLSSHLQPGRNELTLADASGNGSGYQVDFGYHVPAYPSPQGEPLGIAIDYDRTDLTVGQTMTATATISNHMAATAPMVLVDLPIPAGFSADVSEFEAMVSSGQIAKYQMTPRSAIVYLRSLDPNRPLVLRYRLTATMPVKISVPSASVYEYYDPAKRADSAPAAIVVKPAA